MHTQPTKICRHRRFFVLSLLALTAGCAGVDADVEGTGRNELAPQDRGGEIRLKVESFTPTPGMPAPILGRDRLLILQPKQGMLGELHAELVAASEAGVRLAGFVPTNALAATIPGDFDLGRIASLLRWADEMKPEWKISPALAPRPDDARVSVLVSLRPGVVALPASLVAVTSADFTSAAMPPGVIGVTTTMKQIREVLARSPDVTWIRVASRAIVAGEAHRWCLGSLTQFGHVPEFARAVRPWSQMDLTWSLDPEWMTPDLDVKPLHILEGIMAWNEFVPFQWSESTGEKDFQVAIRFVTEAHGDGKPFPEEGGPLAHAYYPPQPPSEKRAGDIHVNDDYTFYGWPDPTYGAEPFHLQTVISHEVGHALGLDHSGLSQDVMYEAIPPETIKPLTPTDGAAMRALYPSGN